MRVEDLDIASVKTALSRLRGTQTPLFGAEGHGFRLNPPLSELEVAAFELQHRIVLPSDYRRFITHLGTGGVGPFYGIFPLGLRDDNFDLCAWRENDGVVGVLSKAFPFQNEWNDLSAMPQDDLVKRNADEYDRQIKRFDEVYWSCELVNGTMPICHEGCALRILLVVTGEQAGGLWEDRRSEYQGLKPVRLSDGSPATFFRWYKEWLDKCLATAG